MVEKGPSGLWMDPGGWKKHIIPDDKLENPCPAGNYVLLTKETRTETRNGETIKTYIFHHLPPEVNETQLDGLSKYIKVESAGFKTNTPPKKSDPPVEAETVPKYNRVRLLSV